MTDSPALLDLQREVARFVTDLTGADRARTAEIVPRVRADRAIPARERLDVYWNAYFQRIRAALRDDYGALCAVMGEAGFHDLVKLYLIAHPSRTFSLRYTGARLARFLTSSAAQAFARRWRFAADLAELEWARVDVFDAPDAEPLQREALARVDPTGWADLRFWLVPAHRRLALDWPVHRIHDAWSMDLALPAIEPEPTHVLVYRRGSSAAHRALSAAESLALELVHQRYSFGELCGAVARCGRGADPTSELLGMLERWLADGILTSQVPLA